MLRFPSYNQNYLILPTESLKLRPEFNINSVLEPKDAHLFVFASEDGISFCVLNSNHVFTNICVYNFDNSIAGAEKYTTLQKILSEDNLAQQSYNKMYIIWSSAQSIITPQPFFVNEAGAEMLNLVYGDAVENSVKSELILKQNTFNVYRVDASMEKLVTNKFPMAMQWHLYSMMVNFLQNKKDLLYCNFDKSNMAVMLRKDNQLQVVQAFGYTSAKDAAYHLLNVCQRFGVSAADTVITLSGFVDESSGQYNELSKYFAGINFLELTDAFNYADEIKTYPAHYFSHLSATIACVL